MTYIKRSELAGEVRKVLENGLHRVYLGSRDWDAMSGAEAVKAFVSLIGAPQECLVEDLIPLQKAENERLSAKTEAIITIQALEDKCTNLAFDLEKAKELNRHLHTELSKWKEGARKLADHIPFPLSLTKDDSKRMSKIADIAGLSVDELFGERDK